MTDRDWSQRAPAFKVASIMNGDDQRLTLRLDVETAGDLGASNFFETEHEADPPYDPTDVVLGGPNDGLAYFRDLTIPVFAYYVLNEAAMAPGSSFYVAQPPETGATSNYSSGGTNWCGRSVVASQLPGLVRDHELRHIQVYQTTFASDVPHLVRQLESRVSTSGVDLWDEYKAARELVDSRARAASNAIHTSGRGNPDLTVPHNTKGDCVLKNSVGEELRNDTIA